MKRIWWIIVGSTLVVVLLPLAIDWFIIGNSFPSNISNSDWVGFLGGYIGSIMGCVISLVGILWTINFTREQNRADRKLQIRPYFDIRYAPNENSLPNGVSWLGYVKIDEYDDNGGDVQSVEKGLLYLKNVGNGPATNISVEVTVANIKVKYKAQFTNQNLKVTTNSVRQGEEAAISFFVYNNRITPTPEDFTWYDNGFGDYNPVKFPMPSPYEITIQLHFRDLLGTSFSQRLKFDARYGMKYDKQHGGKYHCDLYLAEIDSPQEE